MVLGIALATGVASCGGGEATPVPTEATGVTEVPDAANPGVTTVPSGSSDDVDGDDAVPIPVARFAAHGPQATNTIGPNCADGIDTRGGDVFRFTPPVGWVWWGTSGGTGSDTVTVDADGVKMFVTESSYAYETEGLSGWTIIGPSGTDLNIDGESVPMMDVTLDGATGYAIVDLPYLGPLPLVTGGWALGTVVLTSDTPGRPTLEEAAEILQSVRIERCAAVGEALIWGPGDGVQLVPRFEPDPLGKVYPEQPQPPFAPASQLEGYSVEQVAYLMPVEADIAMCAAEAAMKHFSGDPLGALWVLTPSSTAKEDLSAVIAHC